MSPFTVPVHNFELSPTRGRPHANSTSHLRICQNPYGVNTVWGTVEKLRKVPAPTMRRFSVPCTVQLRIWIPQIKDLGIATKTHLLLMGGRPVEMARPLWSGYACIQEKNLKHLGIIWQASKRSGMLLGKSGRDPGENDPGITSLTAIGPREGNRVNIGILINTYMFC